jgi:hypothetical protein
VAATNPVDGGMKAVIRCLFDTPRRRSNGPEVAEPVVAPNR